VPLGVLQRNENKLDEMCDIMGKLHDYVPARDVKQWYDLFQDGHAIEIDEEMFHQILFGGDQLTVARARGSVAIRSDHHSNICSSRDRLEGLLPVCEDWHAKQCLLKVIMSVCLNSIAILILYLRPFGSIFTRKLRQLKRELWLS